MIGPTGEPLAGEALAVAPCHPHTEGGGGPGVPAVRGHEQDRFRGNAELVAAVSKARKTLEDSGFEVDTSTPEEFASVVKAGLERYKKITAEAGIEPE